MASSTSSGLNSIGGGFKMGGLVSGLDTEQLVKQMAAGTKNKINREQQKLDLLSWKQESYRGVTEKLTKFKNTYFDFTSDSNLKSNALMNAYKATSSNGKVKVSAGSSTGTNSYTISNFKKAETASISSSAAELVGGIKLDMSDATEGTTYNISVELDGLKKQISFKAGESAAESYENLAEALNDKDTGFGTIIQPGGEVGRFDVSATGKMTLNNNDPAGTAINHTFVIDHDYVKEPETEAAEKTLKALGLTGQTANKVTKYTAIGNIDFSEPLQGNTFEFSINGKDFSFDQNSTVNDIMNSVNNAGAGVTMSFDSLSQKFTLKANSSGEASQLRINQKTGNLLTSIFGERGADGSGVGAGTAIGAGSIKPTGIASSSHSDTDMSFFRNRQFSLTVDGVTKTIGIWGYDQNGTKITYEDIKDSEGKVTKTGAQQLTDMLNQEITRAFGANAPTVSFSTDKCFEIVAKGTSTVSVGSLGADGKELEGAAATIAGFGFDDGQTNAITKESTITDLQSQVAGMNLKFAGADAPDFIVTDETTIEEFNTALEGYAKIDIETGALTISKELDTDSVSKSKLEDFFGMDYDKLVDASKDLVQNGTDGKNEYNKNGTSAVITVSMNGGPATAIANSTNTISLNGTSINLDDLTEADIKELNGDASDPNNIIDGKPITIDTTRDTEKAFEAVVKFVNDYNTLIDDLSKEINTFRPTSNGKINGTKYEPLTEEQREEMSDKQIEDWEKKAKVGLLYGDPALEKTLSLMRMSMTTFVEEFGLKDMGITASGSYQDKGKLTITESDLKTAFANNADKIAKLFTGENGLMASMESAVDYAVSTKSTNTGILIMQAGMEGTRFAANNAISRQIEQYSETIDSLNKKYVSEQQRYWSQFTALEKQMASIADQNNVLGQFMGTGQ